ncbi:acyltransferase family protein [Sphaerisporangium rubeum]|uniref:Peptidoglycan/LPS O-acetylase OafA/YrhL n=1 Tax=Sphaerisporangium rubeum TaxID=321317 RepID=A0A7X0IFC0_9ACTN|nr:peptidoglycan/LPS O-acetylase OafA/YrhL [Sphaerisporangium rubeum]
MRIIAALLVFLCHAVFPLSPGNQNPTTPFADPGVTQGLYWFFSPGASIGVSFFFILSGFVITWSWRPGQRTGAYVRRRLVKIMPNHVVTWGLSMLLFAAAFTPAWGLPNLFLVNAWSSDPNYWGGANMPAWSLCSEILFYLLFPLLIIPIRKIADNRLWLWAVLTVGAMALTCVATLTLLPSEPRFPGEALALPQFWFIYMFPPVRLLEFVLGMVVARIVIQGRFPRFGLVPAALLVVVAYAATLMVPSPWNQTLVTAAPFALAIGAFATANLRGRLTVLGTKPMVWLGNVSFGFYMTQALVLFWLVPTLFPGASYGVLGGTLLVIGLTLLNVVAGWLLYKLVEQPAMKHWSRSKKTPPAPRHRVEDPSAAVPA